VQKERVVIRSPLSLIFLSIKSPQSVVQESIVPSVSKQHVLVVIVGLSGAGKSTARMVLEDYGYHTIGILPVALAEAVVRLASETDPNQQLLALQLGIATQAEAGEASRFLTNVEAAGWQVHLLFLDCSNEMVVQRYSETRRPHPQFSASTDATLTDTVLRERELLSPFRERANFVIDTTGCSIHDLRREVGKLVAIQEQSQAAKAMRVHIQSFGFKYGIPRDCDVMVDVRFLNNPHFVPELRPLSGMEASVREYVLNQEPAQEFLSQYATLLNFLIPHYQQQGKAYLNVSVGCTGGKHRSVALAEKLVTLVDNTSCVVSVSHRDEKRW
jgi:RNase adapter protein RapZ